jgi:hypothetical protein
MDAKPLRSLSKPDECFFAKWHKGKHLDKQDVFILILLILSGLVLLIGILVGVTAITDDLFDGTDEDQAVTRNGTEQRLAWFSETLKLTDDQETKIRPILEDEHSRVFGPRQDSLLSLQEKRAKLQDIRTKTLDQMCVLEEALVLPRPFTWEQLGNNNARILCRTVQHDRRKS